MLKRASACPDHKNHLYLQMVIYSPTVFGRSYRSPCANYALSRPPPFCQTARQQLPFEGASPSLTKDPMASCLPLAGTPGLFVHWRFSRRDSVCRLARKRLPSSWAFRGFSSSPF
mgnify:CR=1 FL=1